ncbi:NADPH oxidase 4 [Bimuria novae-zelandiae CBS 107.79]|uniref:NADPH oxidase 4 n=1 Tax=Bimuria novae-zelandiae CBS 107.79 TaxID=1447943 RepID=A0A6A5UR13_9PLEO|nr:NADPH oxidase 4 [Bimuria novae-zelandiae CBS 107.79]
MAAPQQYLTDDEINRFIDDLYQDNNGNIDYKEPENKLDEVGKQLAPKPKPHHIYHDEEEQGRHDFLRTLIGTHENSIPQSQFAECVRCWEIPSLEQDRKEAKGEDEYVKGMSVWRKLRAYWAVQGPQIAFMALVVAFMLAFGIWQLVKYLTYEQYRPAFGWGAVLAKTCAGVLYPTFFFLILSMSRWFSTLLRRNYIISRFVNWDLSQSFHIKMSIVALAFATIHAIGHLRGSFVFGSKPGRQQNVAVVLGQDAVPRYYIDYVRSLPGWTGLAALGCFYLLTILSMPQVRKWNYEVFQLGHLLLFPIIGLMCAHGTAGLLQWPMFGYWLAFPTLLVVLERLQRFMLGFFPIVADLELVDGETVAITTSMPKYRFRPYKDGQYVFVQVPKLSFFQWHPFTVSTCTGKSMQIHIKAEGDWTDSLRDLAKSSTKSLKVGIDGPFGAPAQRFYDFEYSMVFGAGIGVTPFSGILADLQEHELERSKSSDESQSRERKASEPSPYEEHKRIDFHWMVREKNDLLCFSDLLNEVTRGSATHSRSNLDIRIHTYVTQKRKEISTHVLRWLIEKFRTPEHPQSYLTGLLNPTHFGRPEIGSIMEEHYGDMCKVLGERTTEGEKWDGKGKVDEVKVGIFYCGPPVIGMQLADRRSTLTARGRAEGRKVEYHFMMEVFG